MTEAWPDHRARAGAVLARVDAGALVVNDPCNVRYLTGFTGSNGAAVVSSDGLVLVTDGRYLDQAAAECPAAEIVQAREVLSAGVRVALDRSGDPVAIEAEHVSIAAHRRLASTFPGVDLHLASGAVEQQRRRKDSGERTLIARACALVGEAVTTTAAEVRPGMTERRVASRLEELLLDLGADGLGFEPIVAGGPNSAIPHHQPSTRELQPGDLLKIDAGALVDGYRSDLTRMFVVGAQPTARQLELHSVVAAAAAAARDALAPGVPVETVVAASTTVLAEAGCADRFTHGLGHGVGLEIHEAPLLAAGVAGTIEAGDVLTIEPGVYFPGFGGVRIEDTLAVTGAPDGSSRVVECLTTVTRELRRVG